MSADRISDEAALRACQRRIHGFMLDCNSIGLIGAAENLHKGLKQDAALLLIEPSHAGAVDVGTQGFSAAEEYEP